MPLWLACVAAFGLTIYALGFIWSALILLDSLVFGEPLDSETPWVFLTCFLIALVWPGALMARR